MDWNQQRLIKGAAEHGIKPETSSPEGRDTTSDPIVYSGFHRTSPNQLYQAVLLFISDEHPVAAMPTKMRAKAVLDAQRKWWAYTTAEAVAYTSPTEQRQRRRTSPAPEL